MKPSGLTALFFPGKGFKSVDFAWILRPGRWTAVVKSEEIASLLLTLKLKDLPVGKPDDYGCLGANCAGT